MKKRTVIFSVLTVLWCAVIFLFSAQNADESTDLSDGFIYTICDAIVPEFDDYTEAERQQLVSDLAFGVRKTAHFTVYAVLGALVFQAFCLIRKKPLRSVCSVGFAFLYACSDEFHQTFVEGRSGQFTDVLIDTSGALLAVLVSLLILHFAEGRRKKKTEGLT